MRGNGVTERPWASWLATGGKMQLERVHGSQISPQNIALCAPRPRRAIVIDAERSSQRVLCDDLVHLGCQTAVVSEITELRGELADGDTAPDLIAAEYRLAGKRLDDLLELVPRSL